MKAPILFKFRFLKVFLCACLSIHFFYLLANDFRTLVDYIPEGPLKHKALKISKESHLTPFIIKYYRWILPVPQAWNMYSPDPPKQGLFLYAIAFGEDPKIPALAILFAPDTKVFREKVYPVISKDEGYLLSKAKEIHGREGWFKFTKMAEFFSTEKPEYTKTFKRYLGVYVANNFKKKYSIKPKRVEIIEVPYEVTFSPTKEIDILVRKESIISSYEF